MFSLRNASKYDQINTMKVQTSPYDSATKVLGRIIEWPLAVAFYLQRLWYILHDRMHTCDNDAFLKAKLEIISTLFM
jgi:hypothetical protein